MTLKSSLVVCGLPNSGKTTFLAALWQLVESGEKKTALELKSLSFSKYEYVNKIRKVWLEGIIPERTDGGPPQIVGIDLTDDQGSETQLFFPDHSGEVYDSLWEDRTCSTVIADQIRQRFGTLLFIGSNTIRKPRALVDEVILAAKMHDGLPADGGDGAATDEPAATESENQPWEAKRSPDQVKLVDILQAMTTGTLSGQAKKLAVFVSAWDLVDKELSPEKFVAQELPLLHQFLAFAQHGFEVRVYGLSAQGGKYVKRDHVGELPNQTAALLNLPTPSDRIKLVYEGETTHDLTEPIAWLMK